ncbi:hypothetical protein Glove_134g223 [Diversispora epigaea]|uniref:PQ-loop repeat-containing protein n=1 Tax=Diversispora epigaea TaxID=1348612 RepID=A0A397J5Y2_9GLOM|nr:hypothetical protein Glove_134g223 [Diversispora epigaea]
MNKEFSKILGCVSIVCYVVFFIPFNIAEPNANCDIAGILLIIQVLYYRNREIPSKIINDDYESTGKLETPYQIKQNSTFSPISSSTFSRHKQFFVILVGTFLVFLIGISVYSISDLSLENFNTGEQFKNLPQLLGWFSAIFYLGSRIPQIIKNYRLKSTKDRDYLLVNLPWLCGYGGTVSFDFVILLAVCYNITGIVLIIQVLYYRNREIPGKIINESAGKSATSYQLNKIPLHLQLFTT